ncbi:MAG: Signal peptidase I [Parcubacteria group bacterium GW2011_GWA2_47_21]|nr:MAG: Signal peptidase I [Parcubacteria group bacterium GW2011_GWA2_47_21]
MNKEQSSANDGNAANPTPKKENFWWETLKIIITTLAIVLPIRYFIAQPFIVAGSSMYPTFENGEYLIIDEISYRFGPPERGDVIVFRYPGNPKKFYIKRIVGLPEETIKIRDEEIFITTPAGETFELSESYLKRPSPGNFVSNLGPDEYYVLGDNRQESSDSRVWGVLPKELIIGKPVVRLLPIGKIDLYPGRLTDGEAATSD